MQRVYATAINPVTEIAHVAVAIYHDRGHIGILHRADGAIKLLHFGWHDRWADTDIVQEVGFWISPDIEPEHAALIAGYCRLVPARLREKVIAFGFARPDLIFGQDWEVSDAAAKTGLTCSSFVLAVFHRSGLKLVDYDDWIPREEDKPKLLYFLNELKKTPGITPEHIKCHEAGITNGQVRFRPLEVAGAAWSGVRPIGRIDAERIATELADECKRLSATTPQN